MSSTGNDKDQGQPRWWKADHESAWERVKAAFRRDWEQTKHDVSKKHGRDLDQDVGDTVKQAVGKEPVGSETWDAAEPAIRYGHGASAQYKADGDDWNDRVESKLREEWGDLKSGRTWDEVKSHVRSGWDRGRRKLT